MSYVNENVKTRVTQPEKRKAEKLLSLAMTSFLEPTVHRLYKVKAPLRSASSVVFCPSARTSTAAGDLQRSGGLVVADLSAGKMVEFSASDGRYYCDLVSNVEPRDVSMCGDDCLAIIDSNDWGSCVKVSYDMILRPGA